MRAPPTPYLVSILTLAAAGLLTATAPSCTTDDDPSTTSTTSSSSGGASASSSSSTGGGGGGGATPVVYGTCPEGYVSACATIQVPLDHAHPEGEKIDFHFSRYPAATQPAKRQVWLLAGGPGQAGFVFGKRVAALAAAMPDADIFAADHRGTGKSHRLSCPQQDAPNSYGGYALDPLDGAACLDALKPKGDYDRLPFFTTTQAAADVLDAIAAVRTSADEKVFVVGASYGTHWAHRMVQLDAASPKAGAHVDGVVFDGFLTPGQFAFLDYDRAAEEAGEALAAACDADASCTAHIGPGGALAKVKSVMATLETTPCGPFTKDQARTLVSVLLDPWGGRAMIFPAIHRLERCNVEDQDALVFLTNTYFGLLQAAYKVPFVNSGILQNNIVLNELWKLPGQVEPTKAALLAAADAQPFLAGSSLPGRLVDMRAYWPVPPDDFSALPTPAPTDAKLLFLGAKMDAHAWPSQSVKIEAVYPDAPFVFLDGATHTPMSQSPLASDPMQMCGTKIATSFIEADGVLDASCATNDLLPLRLEAPDAAFAMKWWNTADDWGDGTPKLAGVTQDFAPLEVAPSPFAARSLPPHWTPLASR